MSATQLAIEQTPQQRHDDNRRLAAILFAGMLVQALLLAFILLYVNVPAGYNAPYGLSLDSVALFRTIWPYPVISIQPSLFQVMAALVIVALWAIYLAAAAFLWRCSQRSIRLKAVVIIVGFALLFNIVLAVVMPPVLSSDVYNYALYGRAVSLHGLNPYVTPASAMRDDPILAFTAWRDETSRYGPTWIIVSAALAALGGDSVLHTVVIFKVVAALFNLINCFLVFLVARRLGGGDGINGMLLYAWNPLILIETAASGHNDAVMMTFALLALLLIARGKLLFAMAALVLSVFIKYLTALLLVFVVVRYLSRQHTWRQSALIATRLGSVTGLMVVGLYLPFATDAQHVRQLVSGLSPSLNSMPNFLHAYLRQGLAALLINGIEPAAASASSEAYIHPALATAVIEGRIQLALQIVFGLLLLVMVKMVAGEKSDWRLVVQTWGVASLVYLVVVYGGAYPWYMISPLTIAFIGPSTSGNRRLLAWSIALAISSTLLYAWLIPLP